MGQKFFIWNFGFDVIIKTKKYTDGNPVEFNLRRSLPEIVIEGWHNVSSTDRIAIINGLAAKGWIEGKETE